jgi:CO/xanthine dehydrogenase FAD-binding subunit
LQNFEFSTPASLDEAISHLAEPDRQPRILAGGTDLIVQLRQNGFPNVDRVIDIKKVPECNELICNETDGLTLGSAVPCHRIYADAEVVKRYAGLIDAAAIIGGIQIQGRATFGGNLCNSSPSGDTIPALIAYGAECRIAGPAGQRTVSVADFCTGPGANVLETGELLVSIHLPMPPANSGAHYLRFIPRFEMDIAVVGAGAYIELDDAGNSVQKARIGLAAVAPTPLEASEAAALLVGKEVSDGNIEAAAEAAQAAASPISDMRAPAEYRKHLVKVLTTRAVWGAIRRARGEFVPNAVQANGK